MEAKRSGEWSEADLRRVTVPATGWAALFAFFAVAGWAANQEPTGIAEGRSSVSIAMGVGAGPAARDRAPRAAGSGLRDTAVNTVEAAVSTQKSPGPVGAGDRPIR